MHLMLQQPEAGDYVVATGETHTVREFCELAFQELGLDYEKYIKVDERYYRPAEVHVLLGDSTKARRILSWQPKYEFSDLVKEMVHADFEEARHSGRKAP